MIKIIKSMKKFIEIICFPHGLISFLVKTNKNCALLDVGCGNNSPFKIKSIFVHIFYTGIDIGDCHQTKPNLADKYIITSPDNFADKILEMKNSFDVVVSAHNLEHCNHREKTLAAMCEALKKTGMLYLSFPSEKSVDFPSRSGTLNYFDDHTHKYQPPEYNKIIEILLSNNMEIIFSSKSYKPIIPFLVGFMIEPISKKQKRLLSCRLTWSYYGFETIIWAKKT
jgi:SAM-dependent methyltransferase